MNIAKLLKDIELPAVYQREGKDCYYDTYRKKLIEITPEETVRQKVAALFEQKYGVPKDMISLEVPLTHYATGVAGRADIVIHEPSEDGKTKYPVTIIECKNEEILLTDKVVDQAIRYCDVLGGNYIAITNGLELRFAAYDEGLNSYVFLDEILSFDQMVNKEYILPEIKEEKVLRFTLQELNNQELILEYNNAGTWIFGADTEGRLRSFAINLYQAFIDTTHKLPLIKRNSFELVEDIGRRFMDYSNAGGGHYDGIYRAFLVKDRFGEPQIVSMSIFGTDADFRGEKRGSYTSLIVSIDRFKTSHNSLQYNMDKYVQFIPGEKSEVQFFHNGLIGNFKSADVMDIVKRNGHGLKVSTEGIKIGKVYNNKLMYIDDEDVSELVYNLIEYGLLREELRRLKKQ